MLGGCAPAEGWAKTFCDDFISGGTAMRLRIVIKIKLIEKKQLVSLYLTY